MIVVVSLTLSFLDPMLNPTPAGNSRYSRFALLFQAFGFILILTVPGWNVKGPFSNNNAFIPEHPGPPLIHTTSGSLATLLCD